VDPIVKCPELDSRFCFPSKPVNQTTPYETRAPLVDNTRPLSRVQPSTLSEFSLPTIGLELTSTRRSFKQSELAAR
jgi:hypothetical protein